MERRRWWQREAAAAAERGGAAAERGGERRRAAEVVTMQVVAMEGEACVLCVRWRWRRRLVCCAAERVRESKRGK